MKPVTSLLLLLTAISALAQNTPPGEHKDGLFPRLAKRAGGQSQASTTIDAQYYRLELYIRFNPNRLDGRVTARFVSRTDNLSSFDLDFSDALEVNSVGAAAADFTHKADRLSLTLKKSYNRGDTVTVSISYGGVPAADGFGSFSFDSMDGDPRHVWTLSEPYGARDWWPCKDYPADKADSADIIINVPSGLKAVSNGTLRYVLVNDSSDAWHWQVRYPITTYLISLAIGPYEHLSDVYTHGDGSVMPLDIYAYPSRAAQMEEVLNQTRDQLDVLSGLFGPYPFKKEKYGLAQFGWGGGMEHQTITSVGDIRSGLTYLYVHELGHQWFGDALTCASWTDIWLNEGFATYSEALYAEQRGFGGLPPGREAYHAYMGSKLYYSEGTITRDTSSVGSIFNRIVYNKGAWVLHMLRGVMGDSLFFKALRRYAQDPELIYTSVRTRHLRTVFEDVYGQSLETFFDQWLNYSLYPFYEIKWETVPEGSATGLFSLLLTINQQQQQPVYDMPMTLSVHFIDRPDTLIRLRNNQRRQSYTLMLPAEPVSLELDPDNWILKNVRDISGGVYQPGISHTTIYPNPFSRQTTIRLRYWDSGKPLLKIHDIRGRLVRTLQPRTSTLFHDYYFVWDGKNERGIRAASGMYLLMAAVRGEHIPLRSKALFIP